ncbi:MULTISPECIES: YicC/YloC family endoribonuclease [unclassified Desulfurobacterium]|uniref:YicC/YloC family endoribonuclease n=1 Tax=Desulfurobacterium sp. TC5-1 TaxID=1158318 RepID=UPI001E5C5FAE|nr:YicC/YloC family endoribonuclease [Desulfurobacterium sp. TC5-1]
MTGYGKSEASNDFITVTVEVKSINSKNLDLRINLPRIVNNLLNRLNSKVKEYVKRGKVDVYINYKLSPDVEIPVSINYSMAKTYIDAIKKIEGTSGRKIEINMRDLLSMHDIFSKEDIDISGSEEVFIEALENALMQLDAERKKEGEKLKKDIESRLKKIEAILHDIEEKANSINEKIKERLTEKVKKLFEPDDEEISKRIELEIVLIAEKQDVTEEITRLKSHIKRFYQLLNEDFSGKTMDFLCQEMHREINTLGSKLKEINATESVLKIKTEIARIKEQVQNVE